MIVKFSEILKPGDVVVCFIIIFFVIIHYFPVFISPDQEKIVEIIDYKNDVYHYPISGNYKVAVPGPYGTTEIRIKKRKVWVLKASCPHKTCKQMGPIMNKGEIIICIPNRMLIRITGNNFEFDGVSR